MSKLLFANFYRLKKEKSFWIINFIMFCFGIYNSLLYYYEYVKEDYDIFLEDVFFNDILLIGVCCTIFCSLYIGTEYSNGTIRNKLIIGHTRSSIYFSNLIVSTAAGFLMSAAYMATVCIVGIPLIGFFHINLKTVFVLLLFSGVLIMAFTSIFTLMSMLIQNKAVVAILGLLGFFLLFFVVMSIDSRLREPQKWNDYIFIDEEGETITQEGAVNERYLRGKKRALYEFYYDFIPMGQAMQISNLSAQNQWQIPLYSIIIILATSSGGLYFFRRKDLK